MFWQGDARIQSIYFIPGQFNGYTNLVGAADRLQKFDNHSLQKSIHWYSTVPFTC
jgi:hypothetical protein